MEKSQCLECIIVISQLQSCRIPGSLNGNCIGAKLELEVARVFATETRDASVS